ncbi:MAG: hypothetical protein ACLQPN_05185 [Bryobacteraceae bacterium]
MMQAPGQPPAESGGSQDPPSQSVRCSTDGDENETRSLAKQIRGGEKWLIGIGVATLAINSIIALIYYCQLGEMRKAAIASGQAAGAATDAATSAQKALDQSRDLFLKDQRPYVGQTSKSTEGPTFYQNPKTPGYGQIVWNWHMTNYGKSPANSVSFTQEIKLAGRTFLPSYGENGPDIGQPQLPGGDTFDTVISAPMPKDEFDRLLGLPDGISIRIRIHYAGLDGSKYESGLCLSRTNAGSIAYCKQDNYIK